MKKTILIMTIGIFLFGNIGLFAQKISKMPQASVGGKTSGSISKTELLTTGKLSLNLTTKKIYSFVLVVNNVEYPNPSGYLFNDAVKAAINGIRKNTEITFSKITVSQVNDPNAPLEVIKDLKLTVKP